MYYQCGVIERSYNGLAKNMGIKTIKRNETSVEINRMCENTTDESRKQTNGIQAQVSAQSRVSHKIVCMHVLVFVFVHVSQCASDTTGR